MDPQSRIVWIKHTLKTLFSVAALSIKTLVSRPSQRRHLTEWIRSFRKGYLNDKQVPWMCFDAIEFLDQHIPTSARIFEYGSGASTLFWLKKGGIVTSVEHDARWYGVMRQRLEGKPRVDYRLVVPTLLDTGTQENADNPDYCHSSFPGYTRSNFADYVGQIDEFEDETFDIVVIDGRARTSCIKHAAPKVKIGGLLVLDNAERPHYLKNTGEFLIGFTCQRFSGLVPTEVLDTNTFIYTRRS